MADEPQQPEQPPTSGQPKVTDAEQAVDKAVSRFAELLAKTEETYRSLVADSSKLTAERMQNIAKMKAADQFARSMTPNAGTAQIDPGEGREGLSWAGKMAVGLQKNREHMEMFGLQVPHTRPESLIKMMSYAMGDKFTSAREMRRETAAQYAAQSQETVSQSSRPEPPKTAETIPGSVPVPPAAAENVQQAATTPTPGTQPIAPTATAAVPASVPAAPTIGVAPTPGTQPIAPTATAGSPMAGARTTMLAGSLPTASTVAGPPSTVVPPGSIPFAAPNSPGTPPPGTPNIPIASASGTAGGNQMTERTIRELIQAIDKLRQAVDKNTSALGGDEAETAENAGSRKTMVQEFLPNQPTKTRPSFPTQAPQRPGAPQPSAFSQAMQQLAMQFVTRGLGSNIGGVQH